MAELLSPLLKRIPPEELDEKHRAQWDQVNALVGTGAMVEVMANHPAATDFYAEEFYSPFSYNKRDGMLVDVRLKELFRFKMGHRHGCFTCNSGNWNTAQEYGFTPEQLEHVLDPTPGLFSDEELAVLDLADQFVLWNLDASLTPELYERLMRHFTDAQILELGTIGAFYMGWQRFLYVFDLTARDGNCPVPSPSQARATAQVTA